jgi:hypothetical protein
MQKRPDIEAFQKTMYRSNELFPHTKITKDILEILAYLKSVEQQRDEALIAVREDGCQGYPHVCEECTYNNPCKQRNVLAAEDERNKP